MLVRFSLVLAVGLITSLNAYGAPDAAAAPTSEFATLFAQWKPLVTKLAQIQGRYRSDPAADKKALQTEFASTLEDANALRPKLLAAAEEAYLADPNKNQDVNDFLVASLQGLVMSDDFEEAAKLAKILIEHDFDNKALNYFAGMSFFGTNDYQNADKYLTLASESGSIDESGKRYLTAIKKYQGLWEKEQAIRAVEEKADNLPRVKLNTSKGDIVIELFENEAPIATANFISLVEKKYYDGLKFHRVLPHFMAQGGDPKGDGSGGPGYTIPDECRQDNHRVHFRGSLSMAKTAEPDTGGSQFFLTFLPTSHLDGKHTVFGRVIDGFDVLAKLNRVQPDAAGTPDKIVKATVLRKRNHKYEPVKRLDK